jgi:hypothetical protein
MTLYGVGGRSNMSTIGIGKIAGLLACLGPNLFLDVTAEQVKCDALFALR